VKGSLAVFDTWRGRRAAARLVNGRLDDLLIDPADDRIRPGALYRAKAGRQMKGQGGVVLETPDGPLFLRHAKGVRPGDSFLVQATTFAEAGKAAPCTTRLVLKSRFAMVTPGAEGRNLSKAIRDEDRRAELHELLAGCDLPDGVGLVLRTAAEGADDTAIQADIAAMLTASRAVLSEPPEGAPERLLDGPDAQALAIRDWPAPDATETGDGAFEFTGVLDQIEALQSGEDPLPGGGSIVVEATRALIAVDVNTGGDTSPAAGLKANIDALRALPRALRLRGLGGQVVLDLAPMPKKERKQIESVFRSAFRTDPIETSLVGWTPLGHLELIRKRERRPLYEV
jgi:Ribonuclease G/E